MFDELKTLGDQIAELERQSLNTNDLQQVDQINTQVRGLEEQRQTLIATNPELMDNVTAVVSDALAEGEIGVRGLAEAIDSPGFTSQDPVLQNSTQCGKT